MPGRGVGLGRGVVLGVCLALALLLLMAGEAKAMARRHAADGRLRRAP